MSRAIAARRSSASTTYRFDAPANRRSPRCKRRCSSPERRLQMRGEGLLDQPVLAVDVGEGYTLSARLRLLEQPPPGPRRDLRPACRPAPPRRCRSAAQSPGHAGRRGATRPAPPACRHRADGIWLCFHRRHSFCHRS
jgi:hypothetical protein